MILEVLDTINRYLLNNRFGLPFKKAFVCTDFNVDGEFYGFENPKLSQKEPVLVAFNEKFGSYIYQRVSSEVNIDSQFLTSCSKTSSLVIPIRLVGFINKSIGKLDSFSCAERLIWALNSSESIAFDKAFHKYTIEINTMSADKFRVYAEETNIETRPNLDNNSIFAIDYTITMLSNVDLCRLIDCCLP